VGSHLPGQQGYGSNIEYGDSQRTVAMKTNAKNNEDNSAINAIKKTPKRTGCEKDGGQI
jgi:hypothetical protein